jgi:hypothetical protein
MKSLPVYIVEKDGKRLNIDFNGLSSEKSFWTVECQLVESAEQLVKEAKSASNVAAIVAALGDQGQELPRGTNLYNLDVNPTLRDSVEKAFEPRAIIASENLRRVDLEWVERTPTRWLRVGEALAAAGRQPSQRYARLVDLLEDRLRRVDYRRPGHASTSASQLWLASEEIQFSGIDGYSGAAAFHSVFLRSDSKVTAFLRRLGKQVEDEDALINLFAFTNVFLMASEVAPERAAAIAGSQLRRIRDEIGEINLAPESDEFLSAVQESPLRWFDTAVWRGRGIY